MGARGRILNFGGVAKQKEVRKKVDAAENEPPEILEIRKFEMAMPRGHENALLSKQQCVQVSAVRRVAELAASVLARFRGGHFRGSDRNLGST